MKDNQNPDLLEFDLDHLRMKLALNAAREAWDAGETPVGAVLFHGNKLVGKAWNQREMLQDPTAHAEILAITQAASALESWRLNECTLYVTLEPCPMCAGAIMQARLGRLVYGARDPKAGGCGSVLDITGCPQLNHRVEILAGVLEDECGQILRDFFRLRRAENRESRQNRSWPAGDAPSDDEADC